MVRTVRMVGRGSYRSRKDGLRPCQEKGMNDKQELGDKLRRRVGVSSVEEAFAKPLK